MDINSKILKLKPIYAIVISCLIIAVFFVVIGLISSSKSQSTISIKTASGDVFITVKQEVTLEDDTMDKLLTKIKVKSKANVKICDLAKITSKSIMLVYSVGKEKIYFSIIDKKITQINQNEYVSVSGTYLVGGVSSLSTVADNVKSGSNDYQNSIVKLTASFSLGGSWTPIGEAGHPFRGTFDGNGCKISKVNINMSNENSGGFFGFVENATIKDLCLEKVTIRGSYANGVGCIVGNATNTNISGCLVDKNSIINVTPATVTDSVHGVFKQEIGVLGGIVGKFNVTNTNTYTVDNCSSAVSMEFNFPTNFVNTGRSLTMGGIVGACCGEKGEAKIDKCLFTGKLTASGKNVFAFYMANIVGSAKETGQTVSNCAYKSNLNHGGITMYSGTLPIGYHTTTRVYASSITSVGDKYVNEVCAPYGWLKPAYKYGMRADIKESRFSYKVATTNGEYERKNDQYYASGYITKFNVIVATLSNNKKI